MKRGLTLTREARESLLASIMGGSGSPTSKGPEKGRGSSDAQQQQQQQQSEQGAGNTAQL
jgi:hypothetical protein